MALAQDSFNQQYVGSSTTNSFAYNNVAGDVMFADVVVTNGRTISSITYNGVAGTLLDSETGNVSFDLYSYYWIAPATGSNTLTLTINSSGESYLHAGSYSGGNQSAQPDSFASNALGNGTSFTQSTTVVASGCWLRQIVIADGGGLAASTGSTLRGSILNGAVGAFDSNGTVSTGSQSMETTMTNGMRTGIIYSIAPVLVASTRNLGTLGVGQ